MIRTLITMEAWAMHLVRATGIAVLSLFALPGHAAPNHLAVWNTDGLLSIVRPAPSIADIDAVSAGGDLFLGLVDDYVIAWGVHTYGRLNLPAEITSPGAGMAAISAGGLHALALRNDGRVFAWGDNMYGQSAVPNGLAGVVAIAAGGIHSVALKGDGTVAAWGDNTYGQSTVPAGLTGVVAVAAGEFHSLALRNNGTVVGWGTTNYGTLPVPADLANVVAISAGGHSMALHANGQVSAWGPSFYDQTNVPAFLSGVTAIAAGGQVSFARRADGSLVCWGRTTFVPSSLGPVRQIAAGGRVAAVLTENAFDRVTRLRPVLDFDGDTVADLALFDEARSLWYVRLSSNGQMLDGAPVSWWGQPVSGDYDGDGRCDVASYDGAGNWYIRQSSNNQLMTGAAIPFGFDGALPVPQDYDGDGRTDLAVYDVRVGLWYIRQSSNGQLMNGAAFGFGVAGGRSIPLMGDIDGDARGEIAVWDRVTRSFPIRLSLTGQDTYTPFLSTEGTAYLAPYASEMNGDAAADPGIYTWRASLFLSLAPSILRAGTYFAYPDIVRGPLGNSAGRYPTPADYDGDGIADAATYSPNSRKWTIQTSSNGNVVKLTWPEDRNARGLVPLDNQFRINRALGAGP
jgi:hypothetical protein